MANIQVRLDDDLKREAQEIASELGMEIATVIRIFLCQMVRDRALPFVPSLGSDKAKTFPLDNFDVKGSQSSPSREEWLQKTVHTGLEALAATDFASESEVKAIFKKAGADVG